MMDKLLPCPFCGGESLLRDRYINGVANTKHYIRECHHCKATFANWYHSIKKANEAWNRRVESGNEPLALGELHETDNEPLYFHCTVGHWSLNGWHIVKPINYDGVGFKDLQLDNDENNVISAFNYGITWVAYKQKLCLSVSQIAEPEILNMEDKQ